MARPPNRSLQTRLVVAALLEQPTVWRHGYDLSKQTNLSSGTLYPILIRLAEQGLLEEEWTDSDGAGRPRRHAYRLSPSGVSAAQDLLRDDRTGMRRLRPSRAT